MSSRPLRPNDVFVSTRGYKLEQCGDKIRTCGLRSASVGPGRGPPDLVGLRFASVGSKPRSPGPREPSAPERCVQSDTGHRCNTLRQTKISFHICGSLFFVVATRFELATSASRTQRSTKLSHATIINMNCVNIKIINKNPLIVKQKTNMIEEKVAKTIKSRN